MPRDNTHSPSPEVPTGDEQTQSIYVDNEGGKWYEAVEIIQERGRQYKVRWLGNDPTGKPWAPTWVRKSDCTEILIEAWREKKKARAAQKKGKAKARASGATSKSRTRSESTSTTLTTRQSRRNATIPTPSTSTRPPSRAPSPRASSSRVPIHEARPLKRGRTPRGELSEDEEQPLVKPYPRKKRKVEVEVIPPHSPQQSTPDLEDSVDSPEPHLSPPPRGTSSKGKRKARDVTPDDAVDIPVPLTKIGPPRHLKRKRRTETHESAPVLIPSSRTGGSTSTMVIGNLRRAPDKDRDRQRPQSHSRNDKRLANGVPLLHSRAQSPGNESTDSGRRSAGSRTSGKARPSTSKSLLRLEEESGTDEDELLNPSFLNALKPARSRSRSAQLSAETRQLLAQEEEESTQDAAAIIPACAALPPRPVQHSKSPKANGKRMESDNLADGGQLRARSSKDGGRVALQARPSANDTFSREGIVPETQPSQSGKPPDGLARESPAHDDTVLEQELPSTPPRAQSVRRGSVPRSPTSVKKSMKRKRTSNRVLRPVPTLSPSAFRPHLPPADDEDIEEFSSPEKDSKKKAVTLPIPTQDSIQADEFTQDQVDAFMDWEGGAQPVDDPFSVSDEEDVGPSAGPDLPPPDRDGGPRQAMASVLAKRSSPRKKPPPEAAVSPEVPILQELPPTSTTQQADVDSQSQTVLHSELAELRALLEDKDQQLEQLEHQLTELRDIISELENEKAERDSSHQMELKTLRDASEEKSEQISLLEGQMVELQLQLTQLNDHEREPDERRQIEIRELNESLEERNEQVSQLEAALVELQMEIATMQAENERLSAAQESAEENARQLAKERERMAALEGSLADVRAQLSRAEDDSTALSARLESSTQDWERRLKYAEDDRELFKNLYSEASAHAERLARENAALEARAALAEGQVRDGLAMVRGTYEAQAAQLRADAAKWEALCRVLRAKDERTGDELRRRAALEPRLREENERLRREAAAVRADMEKMASVIAQMTDQRDESDEDEDRGGGGDGDGEGEGVPRSGEANGTSDADDIPAPGPLSLQDSDGGELLYVCQHVVDAMMCNETFASGEDVIEHACNTHYGGIKLVGA